MRIQHNIPAMSSYRNYTNNVSALSKNLEKLSSGYRINRAGDDAAGLAISEKMRAQISGLEQAQSNAKSGINLVQTAEGALTEVHDMLNRMYTLAEQSANGTYDNEVDRVQLQKEVDQLRSEINRIADSSNFNGIKLLDGSLDSTSNAKADAQAAAAAAQAAADAAAAAAESATGEPVISDTEESFELSDKATDNDPTQINDTHMTILETDYKPAGKPGFSVALNGISHAFKNPESTSTTANEYVSIKITTPKEDGTIAAPVDTEIKLTEADIAAAYKEVNNKDAKAGDVADAKVIAKAVENLVNKDGVITTGTATAKEFSVVDNGKTDKYTVKADGDRVVFALKGDPGSTHAKVPNYKVSVTGVTTDTIDAEGPKYTTGEIKQTGSTGSQAAAATITYKDEDGKTQTVDVSFNTTGNAAGTAGALKTAIEADGTLKGLFTIGGDDKGLSFTTTDSESKVAVTNVTIKTPTSDGVSIAAGTAEDAHDAYDVGTSGYSNYGTPVTIQSGEKAIDQLASTSIDLTADKVVDGAVLRLGDQKYIFAIGKDSAYKNSENAVYVDGLVEGTDIDTDGNLLDPGLDKVLTKLAEVAQNNTTFSVSHELAAKDKPGKIGLKQLAEVKDSTDMSTIEKLGSYIGLSSVDAEKTAANTAAAKEAAEAEAAKLQEEATKKKAAADAMLDGKSLTLQIGDTSDDFNQMTVDIKDMHASAMKLTADDIKGTTSQYAKDALAEGLSIGNIDIGSQDGAAKAMFVIKAAVNYVSDVRGSLGATQNRLDHTINNLSVMQENIQDAESTIRDVDVAEEMMAYTKNSILVQSAQAMLAQANQLPQGVLQLLG